MPLRKQANELLMYKATRTKTLTSLTNQRPLKQQVEPPQDQKLPDLKRRLLQLLLRIERPSSTIRFAFL